MTITEVKKLYHDKGVDKEDKNKACRDYVRFILEPYRKNLKETICKEYSGYRELILNGLRTTC